MKVAKSAGFLFYILIFSFVILSGNIVSAKDINFGDNTGNIILNGNVGIGTTTPGQKLEILGNILANGKIQSLQVGGSSYMFTMDAANGAGPRLQLGRLSVPAEYFEIGAWNSINNFDSKTRDLKLFTTNGLLYITNTTGQVGIGTTTPLEKLHVYSASNAYVRLESDINQASGFQMYENVSGVPYGFSLFYDGASTNNFLIQSKSSGALTTKVTIQRDTGNFGIGGDPGLAKLYVNGNVGIGTTTPNDLLNIGPNPYTVNSSYLGTGHNSTVSYDSADSYALTNVGWVKSTLSAATSSLSSAIGLWGGTKDGNIWNGTSGAGNVGIGTTNPLRKLEINGSTRITGTANTTSAGTGASSGTTTLTGSNTTFLTDFIVGDGVIFNDDVRTVVAVVSNTSLTVDQPFSAGTPSGLPVYKRPSIFVLRDNASAERWVLSNTGKTGIGAINPISTLDVRGANLAIGTPFYGAGKPILFVGATNALGADIGGSIGLGGLYDSSSVYPMSYGVIHGKKENAASGNTGGYLAFETSNNATSPYSFEWMRINSIGNVGIGTTTPTSRLDVMGAYSDVSLVPSSAAVANFRTPGHVQLALSTQVSSPYTYSLQVKHASAGNASYPLALNPLGGNVGIGTTNPGARLEVSGQNVNLFSLLADNTLLFGRSASESLSMYVDDSNVVLESIQDENTPGYGNMIFRVDNDGTANGYFGFQNKAATNLMRITSAGYVGIGTTTPNDYLTIGQNPSTVDVSYLGTGHNGTQSYNSSDSYALANVGYVNSAVSGSGASFWASSTAGTYSVGTTNVGIGTTNPGTYKLNVAGNAYVAGTVVASSSITVNNGDIIVTKSDGYANFVNVTYASTSWMGARMEFQRSRGIRGAQLPVAQDDTIGWFDYFAYDGAGNQRVAQFSAVVDGSVSSGKVPGRFEIVTADLNGVSRTRLTAKANDNITMATNGGNVGIGTASPASKLQLGAQTTLSTTTPITLSLGGTYSSAAGVNPKLKLYDDGSSLYGLGVSSTQLDFMVPTGAGYSWNINGAEKVRIGSTGSVGIGTTNPSYKLDIAGAIAMHDENQDIDARYYGATFLRGWTSFSAGSEANISYVTDTTSPVGNQVLEMSTAVWARGPKIPLDITQNYEVEMWVKRESAGTTQGTFYFVVSNYDSAGVIIGAPTAGADGTDWNYPVSALNQTTMSPGVWTKYRFIVGPYGGEQNHNSSAKFISLGFLVNNGTGANDVMRLTGFKIRPIPRYNNDALTITNSGKVGIGTTTPTDTLNIGSYSQGATTQSSIGTGHNSTQSYSSDDIYAITNVGYVKSVLATATSSLSSAIGLWGGTKDSNIWNGTSGTGNVGIGTTNPTFKLDVNGNFRASGVVNIESSNDQILQLKQLGMGGTAGVKDAGWNYIGFLDSEGDRQGYFGIASDGNFIFNPEVSGALVNMSTNLTVGGDITVSGGDLSINNNNGGVNFSDVSAYWLKTSTNWGMYWDTTLNQIQFNGGGVNKSFIDLDDGAAYFAGNVGMGTSAPYDKLEAAGAIAATNSYSGNNSQGPSTIMYYNPASDFGAIQAVDWGASYKTLTLNALGGNVGIGTTAPAEKLSVNGFITIPRANNTNDDSPGLILSEQSNDDFLYNSLYLNHYGLGFYIPINETSNTGTYLSGWGGVDLFTGGVNRLSILRDGYVGIGTSTPLSKLHVVDNSGIMVDGSDSGILFRSRNTTATGNPQQLIIKHNLGVVEINNEREDLSLQSSSAYNVGIGTTNPGYKLEVAGAVGATSFEYTSDRSLKKNIETIKNPLTKIMNLRGVTFNWKKDNEASLGLIAQEVEMVFPELVSNNNGIRSVQYGNLVAPLIEAVKEQQKEIDNLNERIKALETKKKGLTK